MKNNFGLLPTLAAALALLFALNFITSTTLGGLSLDLTEESLYTLSDGSKSIVGRLGNDITLKLFYSKTLATDTPQMRQYAERVLELLRQYEGESAGAITVETFDPRPDTEEEEWAVAYGLQAAQLSEQDDFYFGLVAVSDIGREEALPFLTPAREQYLEYDLTRMISALGGGAQKVVGIMTTLSVAGNENDPMVQMGAAPPMPSWAVVEELSRQFEVRTIDPATPSPSLEGLDFLLVIHPVNFTPAARYALDQYIVGGGRALVALDPLSVAQRSSTPAQQQGEEEFASDLPELLKGWGLFMDRGKVVADPALATTVFAGEMKMKHPTFISLTGTEVNPDEVVTAELSSLLFVHSGRIEKTGDGVEGLHYTPLIQTTDQAGSLEVFILQMVPDPATAMRQFDPYGKKADLATLVSGTFTSAFPDGPPEGVESGTHMVKGETPSAVVVTGDADWLWDQFSVERRSLLGQTLLMVMNDNLALAGNLAEVMSGEPELVNLRTRGNSNRPFTLVAEMEREAEKQWRGAEEALLAKQDEANRRLTALQASSGEDQKAVLASSQLEEIRKFRTELAQTKKKLREVRRNLRQDVERLGGWLKFINIIGMPLLVLGVGFIPLAWRQRKTSRPDVTQRRGKNG